jgi:predicted phosphodiesterase
MLRRSWLSCCTLLLLVQAPAGPPVITHGPYLMQPAEGAVTVVWHTDRVCVSRVEYGTGGRLDQAAVSSRHGLIDNDRTSHVVRLTGLEPGVTYDYRVVSKAFLGYRQQHIVAFGDSVVSDRYRFTALDPGRERFAFTLVSDVHERASELDSLIAGPAWAEVDFAIADGDLVDDFMREDQLFTGFLDVLTAGFAREKPVVFARGNHEERGRYARRLEDFLPTVEGRAYYSFDHGGVHFVVLDTGEDKEDGHEYYNGLVDFERYRAEQAVWLEADLSGEAARAARWRVVISHIPPRGGDGYAIGRTRDYFEPAANAAGVDLWLAGHTHRLQVLEPAPEQNRYWLLIGPTHAATRVEVTPAALEATVYGVGGEVLRRLSIRR